jgi:hypothetical protein
MMGRAKEARSSTRAAGQHKNSLQHDVTVRAGPVLWIRIRNFLTRSGLDVTPSQSLTGTGTYYQAEMFLLEFFFSWLVLRNTVPVAF